MPYPTHANHSGAHAVAAEPFGNGVRLLLNHPDALNSLDLAMVEELCGRLSRLAADAACGLLVLDAPPGRAFCAGGDVKMIAEAVAAGDPRAADEFFATEYEADLAIHGFPKPVAAIADGICMGGGLGLAAGADVVVATENTVMAMPEARIGFFPDVLATRWLWDRCPEGFGGYLTLSAALIKGKSCTACGLATHFAPSGNLLRVRETLAQMPSGISRKEFAEAFAAKAGHLLEDVPPLDEGTRAWLSAVFMKKTGAAEIRRALGEDRLLPEKSREALARMDALCPTSLTVTHFLLEKNRSLPLAEVAASDRAAARFMTRRSDYTNGVRARLLTRGEEAAWDPPDLSGVRLPD